MAVMRFLITLVIALGLLLMAGLGILVVKLLSPSSPEQGSVVANPTAPHLNLPSSSHRHSPHPNPPSLNPSTPVFSPPLSPFTSNPAHDLTHRPITTHTPPSAGFVPEAIVPLAQGFGVLLVNHPSGEWEIRLFSNQAQLKGGIGAYAIIQKSITK